MQKSVEPLVTGREYPKPDEAATTARMVLAMQRQLDRLYTKPTTLRQVHSKMHGCVKAEFTVEPDLTSELRVGVFREPRSYPAWVRFSNGDTKIRHDKKKDTRGTGIKLMGVPGKKLLGDLDSDDTHDFILSASRVFFAKDMEEFEGLLSANTSPGKLALPLYLLSHPKILLRAATKMLISCKHPLSITYNSITPYRFGDGSRAVKYGLFPSAQNKLEYTDAHDYNFLRHNMVETLGAHDISFDFCVQFQTDANDMPIEDSTVEWTSPFTKLATLRIPQQVFDTPEQRTFGENLTYNIWHSLDEHKPLGSFNRARKVIYEALYKHRLDKNQVIATAPTAVPDFFKNLIPQ